MDIKANSCNPKGHPHPLSDASQRHPAKLTRGQYLEHMINQILVTAKGDGIPRIPTPKDTVRMRHETLVHIDRIRTLEEERAKRGSSVDFTLQDALMLARATYQTYFPRIFRFNELPTEIVTNIFRYVVWPVPNPALGVLYRLYLTWTCRRWREIAIADFTLWNAIWFRDRAPFTRSWTFLERSKSLPLDLRIGNERGPSMSLEDTDSLLDQLLPIISRIRILIYIGSSWEHVALLLKKLQTTQYGAPNMLERLEIHRLGSVDYSKRAYFQSIALFDGQPAPRLYYLSLNGVHINWNTGILGNLTTLDFRKLPLELCPTIARFREMLTLCPLLRKLCMDGAGPQFDLFDPAPCPIVMENLKILVICDFSASYACNVLSHFTAPNLIDLTFINLTGEDYSRLYELLVGRFTKIKLLTMYSVALVSRGTSLVKWLASIPQLMYLRVASLSLSFFELLLVDPRTVIVPGEEHPPPRLVLAPNLAVIESHPSVIVSLVDFTAKRKAMGVPLKRIYVTRTEDATENQELRKACMDLTKMTSVHFMVNGTRTPEEDAIMAE